jgi:hypothetical protein
MFALAKSNWGAAISFHALSPVVFAFLMAFAATAIVRLFRPSFRWSLPPTAWNSVACVFLAYGAVRMLSGTPAYAQTPQVENVAAPKLFTVGFELRGRFETFTGQSFVPGRNNEYYLSRLRFNLGFQPLPWMRFVFQVQDSRAPGYPDPKPSSSVDPVDLRIGYLELGRNPKAGWSMRAGRQELIFGEERLVGASNWGNVARSFDALRLTWANPGKQLDWFASSVVVPDKSAFDRSDLRNRFYGFYSRFERLVPGSQVEPFVFWRSEAGFRNELKERGRLEEVTMGLRALGRLPDRFDYGLETALQTGQAAGAPIAAWAGHFGGGYTLGDTDRAPRLQAQFNCASGDDNSRDGRVKTFDNLFPTNHQFYGIGDRMGWRNMREGTGGIGFPIRQKWRFATDYHFFWLATVQDALYFDNGSAFVRNPKATSRRVDDEIDITAAYQHNTHFSLLAGYAHLIPRAFLKQSTPGSAVSGPYVMWTYRY